MSRYICQGCKTEHGEDNMAAYCSACFHKSKISGVRANEDEIKQLKGVIGTAAIKCFGNSWTKAKIAEYLRRAI